MLFKITNFILVIFPINAITLSNFMELNRDFNAPPTNFPTTKHATHGFSSRVSPAQAIAYFVIALTICIYFSCLNYIYQNFTLLSFFSVFGLIMLISSAYATLTNPTDRVIYYYKSSLLDRTISFKPDYQKIVFCDHCDSYCLKDSKHCRSCNRCVQDFDHHCMWFNNCVGKGNYKAFFISIVSTFGFIAVFLIHGTIMSVSVAYSDNFQIGRAVCSWVMMAILIVFQFLLFNLIILHLYLSWTGQSTYSFLKRKSKQEEEEKQKLKQAERIRKQSTESISKATSSGVSIENTLKIEVGPSKQIKIIEKIDEVDEKQSQICLNLDKNRTITKDTSTNENRTPNHAQTKDHQSQNHQIQGTNQIILFERKPIKKLPSFFKNNGSLNFILDSNEAQSPTHRKIGNEQF